MSEREGHAKRPRKTHGSGKKKKAGGGFPPWLIVVCVVGGLLLLVGASVGGWLLFSSGPAGRSGIGEGPEQAMDISREPVPVRERKSAYGHDISLPVAASPDPWKVTPDTIKPAEGLRSVFGWPEADPNLRPYALLFTPANTAQAAVLAGAEPLPKTWIRYDLKTLDPIGRVDLGNYKPDSNERPVNVRDIPFLADLSPSGNRLAMQATHNPPSIHVWSSDGKKVARLQPTISPGMFTWLGLIDDARVLTLEGGQLRLQDVATGQVVYTVKGTFQAPVVLSPSRTWAVAFDGKAFVWIQTADGTICGRTPTPVLKERAGEFVGSAHGAFSPDGTRFLASRTARGAMGVFRCLSVWDVATGKPTNAGDYPGGGLLHVQWCGPRQVLLGNSQVIDLDLGTKVWQYTARDGIIAPTTPDGRLWYVAHWKPPYKPDQINEVLPLLEGSRNLEAVAKSGWVLAAWTVPHAEAKARMEAHKNALVLSKMSVRVQVQHDDQTFRQQAGENLADALAAVGCRVSPQSEGLGRLTISPVKDGMVAKFAGTFGPSGRMERAVPGKIVEGKLEVLDSSGAVRWSVTFESGEPDTTASAENVARKKFLDRLRLLVAGSGGSGAGTLPSLDAGSELGIDELPDPPPNDQPKK